MANIVSQSPSISEVKTVLAETSNSVGGLCSSPKINKWAKYKPIRNSSKGDIQESDYVNANYGIQFPIYSNVASLIEGITTRPLPGEQGNEPIWEYLRPQGSASQPYRIGDFRGYKHNSVIPFGLFNMTQRASKTGGSPIIMGSVGFVDSSEYQIGLQDFNFGNRRFAMAYRKGINDTPKVVVNPNVGEFTVELNVAQENLDVGFYEGYLFMTGINGSLSNVLGFEGHPNPNILNSPFRFQVVTQTVTVSIMARYNKLNRNQFILEVRANNETGGNVSLPLSQVRIRNSANACNSTIQQYEQLDAIGTLVAPPGSNIILTKTYTILRDEFPMWKVCWSNGGAYPNEFSANIIQEM